jgi:Na+/H+-translocating membrane pyrophosphatase
VNDPNPYRAPEAPVRDPGTGPQRPTWVAILAGLAADVGGTFIGSIVVTLVLGVLLTSQGIPAVDVENQLGSSGPYQVFSLLFGLSFTVLGGYVAARVANRRELWHGMVLGIASLAFGEVYIALFDLDIAFWQRLASWVAMIPAGIWGASIYRKRKRRE